MPHRKFQIKCSNCDTLVWRTKQQLKNIYIACSPECKGILSSALQAKPNGERYINSRGYVAIRQIGQSPLLEHRKVMQEYIGRPLSKHEDVHHVESADTQNNDISNLELHASTEHHRYHSLRNSAFRKHSDDTIFQALDLHLQGLSNAEVGRRTGLHPNSIKRILRGEMRSHAYSQWKVSRGI